MIREKPFAARNDRAKAGAVLVPASKARFKSQFHACEKQELFLATRWTGCDRFLQPGVFVHLGRSKFVVVEFCAEPFKAAAECGAGGTAAHHVGDAPILGEADN